MLVKNKVNVISREDLFSLATEIYFNAKHYAHSAKYSAMADDYIGYSKALRAFEDMRSLMQNPIFSEWDYAEELEHVDIPVYTISDYINRHDSPVDDDCDVPF